MLTGKQIWKFNMLNPKMKNLPPFCFAATVQHAEITTPSCWEKKKQSPRCIPKAINTQLHCLPELVLRSAKTQKSCKNTRLDLVNCNCVYLAVRKDTLGNTTYQCTHNRSTQLMQSAKTYNNCRSYLLCRLSRRSPQRHTTHSKLQSVITLTSIIPIQNF